MIVFFRVLLFAVVLLFVYMYLYRFAVKKVVHEASSHLSEQEAVECYTFALNILYVTICDFINYCAVSWIRVKCV